jgi:hypothetical protein
MTDTTKNTQSNIAKGRHSKDATIGEIDVAFINHNVSEYPVTVGAASFAPVPVEKEKDISLNVAREHAKQEYERIMEMVRILQEQAKQLMDRVDATELVHSAEYSFITTHNRQYHIYFNTLHNKNVLGMIGPDDWYAGQPTHYNYITSVRKKGDSTWEYIDENSAGN